MQNSRGVIWQRPEWGIGDTHCAELVRPGYIQGYRICRRGGSFTGGLGSRLEKPPAATYLIPTESPAARHPGCFAILLTSQPHGPGHGPWHGPQLQNHSRSKSAIRHWEFPNREAALRKTLINKSDKSIKW